MFRNPLDGPSRTWLFFQIGLWNSPIDSNQLKDARIWQVGASVEISELRLGWNLAT
jgi:hypothetical protein